MARKAETSQLTAVTMAVFIVMNFVLSMSSYVFNGILDKIAVELAVPLAQTGNLTSFYAYGAGIGVPVFLVLFRSFDRSALLKSMLVANILATAASILSPNFTLLLISRFLMGLAGNCYGVLATATIASLSPREKVGTNLSLLIAGSASALMVGIPLTRVLIEMCSWKVIFAALIVLMLVSLAYFSASLPRAAQSVPQVNLAQELGIARQRSVAVTLLASIVTFVGYGALYTYLTPYLIELSPGLDASMGLILAAVGFCSLFGNLLGGFACDRIGFRRSLRLGTAAQIAITLALFATRGLVAVNLALVFVWMTVAWFIGLQLNTAITVVTHNRSNLMISLNNSGIQLGQALGASFMAWSMGAVGVGAAVLVSLATSFAALLLLVLNRRELAGARKDDGTRLDNRVTNGEATSGFRCITNA